MSAGSPASSAAPPRAATLAVTVLAPFAAGYFLSYLYRSINAVVAPDLVRDIGLGASELGLLTAAYLVAFGLFQLPLGLLLDRYGPRRVQTVLLLVAAVGSGLFAIAGDALSLSAARALIGLGFAGGLMAGFKAVVLWFPPERHALANAAIMSVGGLGMIVATVPAELTVQQFGWRGLFVGCGVITVAVAVVLFLVVPERADRRPAGTLWQQIAEIGGVFSDRYFWRLAPLVALTAGSHIGIHTLWAGPWFRDIGGFDRDGVAAYLMVVAVAFLVGTLLAGVVADRLARRGIDTVQVMLWGMGLFALAQAAIIAEASDLMLPMWVVFGMTGQIGVLAFPVLARHFGPERSSRAQTAANLVLFLTAFAAQSATGAVIDLFPAPAGGGYPGAGYRAAFSVLLALQVLAFGWYLLGGRRSGVPALPGLLIALGVVLVVLGGGWLLLGAPSVAGGLEDGWLGLLTG